jgi:predicted nucleic acid-binding protein
MQIYLDTSALVKLVVKEPESRALAAYLGEHRADIRFTAALSRTELVRAVARQWSTDSVAHARRVLGRLDLVPMTNRLLDAAATLMPPELRSLDAIHLAAALTAPDLRSLVTYDDRLAQAVTDTGIAVVAPR